MSLSLTLRNGTGHVRRREAVEGSAPGMGRNEFEAWMSLPWREEPQTAQRLLVDGL